MGKKNSIGFESGLMAGVVIGVAMNVLIHMVRDNHTEFWRDMWCMETDLHNRPEFCDGMYTDE